LLLVSRPATAPPLHGSSELFVRRTTADLVDTNTDEVVASRHVQIQVQNVANLKHEAQYRRKTRATLCRLKYCKPLYE